jgi:hypothetical protein
MLDHTLKSDVTARRLEVITETGRRRWFSKDDKARIVEETEMAHAGRPSSERNHRKPAAAQLPKSSGAHANCMGTHIKLRLER